MSPSTLSLLLLLSLLPLSLSLSSPLRDLLRSHGLPAGLLPNQISSYTHSPSSGLLQVYLSSPCLTKIDTATLAFYDKFFKANLTKHSLSAVQGLSQEELFVWLPVKHITVDDPESGVIVIDIGIARKQLAFSLFEDPPECRPELELSRGFGSGSLKLSVV